MSLLEDALGAIEPLDAAAGNRVSRRLDSLTKPLGSLGILENLARRYAEIRHDGEAAAGANELKVFVADHGVAEEGVSAYPRSVTAEMLRNIARGGAAISVLARHWGLPLQVIDMGVATDTRQENLPGVLYRRIASGTENFLQGNAMSRAQAIAALEVGIELSKEAASRQVAVIGVGEMGIANSTSAAALLAALTGIAPSKIAGRGTGLGETGWRRKVAVVEAALERHRAALDNPIDLLAALGGFEIAAIAGVCLGGAASRVVVVVDGFIATAAAAVAQKFSPGLSSHLLFSHRSAEGGHALVLEHLGARPILDLDLRLGEGTGAALAIAILGAALKLLHEMATFSSAGVSEKLPT